MEKHINQNSDTGNFISFEDKQNIEIVASEKSRIVWAVAANMSHAIKLSETIKFWQLISSNVDHRNEILIHKQCKILHLSIKNVYIYNLN